MNVFNVNTEVRLSGCMLGMLACVWAVVLEFPGPLLAPVFANETQFTLDILAVIMAAQGVGLVIGAWKPIRRLRQIGLALGTFMWFVNFGIFLDPWAFTMLLAVVAALGMSNLLCLAIDVWKKPGREDPISG